MRYNSRLISFLIEAHVEEVQSAAGPLKSLLRNVYVDPFTAF